MSRLPPLVPMSLLVAFLGACGGSSGASADGATCDASDSLQVPDDAPYDAPPIEVVVAPDCADGRVSVRHVAAWPGRGVALLLRSEGPAADRAALLAPGGLSLASAGGVTIPLTVAPAAVEPSFVLLLVDAGAEALRDAAAFVEALPEGTSVALYRRCARAAQVSGFSPARARAASLLRGGFASCPTDAGQPWRDALAAAAAEVWAIGGPIFPARRALVVLTDEEGPTTGDVGALPMGVDAYVLAAGAEPEAGLATVLDRLAERGGALLRAAACLPAGMGPAVELRLPGGEACGLVLPEGPVEQSALACDPLVIAAGAHVAPARVEFLFTADERAIFEQVSADLATDDFELRVRVGDAEPVTAVAHLRGQTSLDCERKNFTLDLKGPDLRVLGPGFAAEEFHLISLCNDDRYYNQLTANRVLHALGLFPLGSALTELRVDGETWGVYLLVQKPKEGLLETTSRLHTVVRRRFDPEDKLPDVEYPPDTSADAAVVAPYWQLVEGLGDLAGEALIAEARSRLDLDHFLTFVAFHSLMGTGDFIDEIYFYSTEAARRADLGDFYDVHAWDTDDLYTTCHHGGQFAMPDPHGLVFCAEGDLEKRLLPDPVVYARFVDALEALIERDLTAEVFDQALTHTASELLPFFDREGVAAAMIELVKKNPAAVDAEVAKADILAAMETTRAEYRARRDKLIGRIADWRAAR